MKKIFFLVAFLATIVLTGCDNYGKKVKINDTVEVYVKGDNATEADAKKLGDYFAELTKGQTNQKSLQVAKENGVYEVRMVVDENKLKTDTTLNSGFEALKMLIETQVFTDGKVKFIITDNHFKDIRSY